ncbi:glycoside hydrolase superfamily [Jimgerdemannia flammicorona]|uniref:Glycoside hydrolase superfamily n=1 Tax=Jimgerdemannia flammicorona TaxID=994334 RepID=A0A433QU24_9FUNG|nr:glycoside hydrolase superfamily [Jimgerdemannia flammicorona]
MAACAAARATFVKSAIQFAQTYGFDGLDIPVAADKVNAVHLFADLRAAAPANFIISLASPAIGDNLNGYDLGGIAKYGAYRFQEVS